MRKPEGCLDCPFAKFSTGFVPDYCPARPKIATMLKMPGREEIVNGEPMTGKAGKFQEREYFTPNGLTRRDILIGNVIRCFPNGGEFPTGALRKAAVAYCRRWDGKLKGFAPNIIGVSFNPAAVMRQPQTGKFLKRAFARAREWSEKGYRPLLLLGEEARETFAPWLEGKMKLWQGHFWKGEL